MMYVILINFQFRQFDPLKEQFFSLQQQLNKFEWPKGPINLGDLKSMDIKLTPLMIINKISSSVN